LAFCLAAPSSSEALPGFRNFFRVKTAYRTGCQVCHQPRDNRLTPYAREYVRLNGGFAALDALDVMDPDKDGFPSKEELGFHSNPGDARSTPAHIGDWLSNLTPSEPPREILVDLYGRIPPYEVFERPLKRHQAQSLERALGQKLRDEELFPVIFLFNKKGEAGAPPAPDRGAYAFCWGKKMTSLFAVVAPEGTLRAVRFVRLYGDQRFDNEQYLSQFPGRTAETLQGVSSPRGAEAQNDDILSALRRCLEIMDVAAPVSVTPAALKDVSPAEDDGWYYRPRPSEPLPEYPEPPLKPLPIAPVPPAPAEEPNGVSPENGTDQEPATEGANPNTEDTNGR